jgi:hypothetical protein
MGLEVPGSKVEAVSRCAIVTLRLKGAGRSQTELLLGVIADLLTFEPLNVER